MPTVDLTAGVSTSEGGVKGGVKTTEKTTEKTSDRIIKALEVNPSASMKDLAQICDITEDGVYYQLRQLKRKGLIRRIGPDKGGHWEIVKPPPQTGGNGS